MRVLVAVDNLVATPGDEQVTLTWTPVAGATGYRVEFTLSGAGAWVQYGAQISAGPIIVTGLTNDDAYDFRVISADGITEQTSNVAQATPTEPTPAQPGTVSDLVVAAFDAVSIDIEWTGADDGTENPCNYQVRWSTNPAFITDWGAFESSQLVSGTVVGTTESHTITGLTGGVTYYIRMISFRGLITGGIYGGITDALTQATTGGVPYAPPATPVVLSVNVDATNITVSASAFIGDQDDTHAVSDWELDEDGGEFVSPEKSSYNDGVNLTSIVFTRAGLTPGADYDVRCRYGGAQGGDSTYATAALFTNTAPAGGGGDWPNVPSGMTTLTTFNISATPNGQPTNFTLISAASDWLYARRHTSGEVITDGTTPSGRGKSWQMNYLASRINEGGEFSEPCVLEYTVPGAHRTKRFVYFGFVCKFSSNWQNHPIGDKLTHFFMKAGGGTYFTGAPGSKVEYVDSSTGKFDLYAANYNMVHGTWYRWEVLITKPTSFPGTGSVEVWLTPWTGSAWGAMTKVVNLSAKGFTTWENETRNVQFSGTYGGDDFTPTSADISQNQFLYFDDATVRVK